MSPGQTGHITGQMGRPRDRRGAHQGVSRQNSLCLLVFFPIGRDRGEYTIEAADPEKEKKEGFHTVVVYTFFFPVSGHFRQKVRISWGGKNKTQWFGNCEWGRFLSQSQWFSLPRAKSHGNSRERTRFLLGHRSIKSPLLVVAIRIFKSHRFCLQKGCNPTKWIEKRGSQQTRVYPYPLGAGSARPNPKMVRSGPGKPNQRKVSSWTFRRGIPEQKFNVNRACFLSKNIRIHKNERNSWTFRFGAFFGLVCRGDSWNGCSRPRKPFISRFFCAQRGDWDHGLGRGQTTG